MASSFALASVLYAALGQSWVGLRPSSAVVIAAYGQIACVLYALGRHSLSKSTRDNSVQKSGLQDMLVWLSALEPGYRSQSWVGGRGSNGDRLRHDPLQGASAGGAHRTYPSRPCSQTIGAGRGPPRQGGLYRPIYVGLIRPRPTNTFSVGWSGIHVPKTNIFGPFMFRPINMRGWLVGATALFRPIYYGLVTPDQPTCRFGWSYNSIPADQPIQVWSYAARRGCGPYSHATRRERCYRPAGLGRYP